MTTPDETTPQPDETLRLGRGEFEAAAPIDATGRRLGPYVLHEELGRGGQGVVMRATDERFDRTVALKILLWGGPDSEELIERFRREAAVAARIDHPGICTVYDAGMIDGVAHIAMRYVPGESIAGLVRRRRDEASAAKSGTRGSSLGRDAVLATAALIEQAARTLHAAHEAHVLHRDVKPGNIMVSPEGECVVMDFGLARDDDSDDATLTRSDALLGTPAYMAPEQIARRQSLVDARTDVWSLGATLYEAVTLERPFTAATREGLYHEILHAEPRPPRHINPSISRDLATVIATALCKEPDGRYQTALDFAEDLKRARDSKPIRARRIGPVGRATRWARRNPALAASWLAVFVSLSVALVIQIIRGEQLSEKNLELTRSRDAERRARSETTTVRESFQGLFTSFFHDDPDMREGARRHLEKFCADLEGEPRSEATAHRHFNAGQAYLALGLRQEAEAQWRAAARLYRALDPRSHLLATALLQLADGLANQSYEGTTTPEDGAKMAAEARAIFERTYGPDSPEVAMADGVLAGVRAQLDGPRESLEIPGYFIKLLYALEKRARPEAAIRADLLRSVATVERAWSTGDRAASRREIRRWIDPHRDNAFVARQIPVALSRITTQAERDGRTTFAEALSHETMAICADVHGARSSDVLVARNDHATILFRHGRHDEAVALLTETLEHAKAWFSGAHPQALDTLDLLGEMCAIRDQDEDAEAWFAERMRITRASVSPADGRFLGAFTTRARVAARRAGSATAAVPYLDAAIELLANADPAVPQRLAEARLERAAYLVEAGMKKEAAEGVQRAEDDLREVPRPRRRLEKRIAELRKLTATGPADR